MLFKGKKEDRRNCIPQRIGGIGMDDIIRHGLLSNLKISDERYEAVHALLKGLKNLAMDTADPVFRDPENRERVKKVISLLISTFLSASGREETDGTGTSGKMLSFPTKEEHYSRNQNMPLDSLPQTPEEAEKLAWDDGVAADCHQFTSEDKKNRKFVSPDGKSEVIFDSEGDIVTAPEDYGTYNFADPNTDPIGHFNKDVLPWLVWGNEEADTTDMSARLRAFVVDGGLHAIKKMENK